MTDFFATADPDDRSNRYAAPPSEVLMPAPSGRVGYAPVYDADGLCGYVWMAHDRAARPRAGILLAANRDPSVPMQDDLGSYSLTYMADKNVEALAWLNYLSETRTGLAGLTVGEVATVKSLAALKTKRDAL